MTQTTLAQGAKWPTYMPNHSRIGMHYTTRKDKGTVKPVKAAAKDTLRQYLADHPGQSMYKIRLGLNWSLSKAERTMTELREEVGNGYFLLKDLKK